MPCIALRSKVKDGAEKQKNILLLQDIFFYILTLRSNLISL